MNVAFNSPEIEICIDSTTPKRTEKEVRAAYLGGADRIELCDQIELGGTTPQKQCIEIARNLFPRHNSLIVMIRPRGNDFFFSVKEIRQMHESIDVAAKAGADGVALGALRSAEGIAYTQELSKLISNSSHKRSKFSSCLSHVVKFNASCFQIFLGLIFLILDNSI